MDPRGARYVKEINEQIKPVLQKVQDLQLPTTRGVSALQVKLHLLLCYVTNLAFYLLLKAEGRDVKDHPVLDQILRARCVGAHVAPSLLVSHTCLLWMCGPFLLAEPCWNA